MRQFSGMIALGIWCAAFSPALADQQVSATAETAAPDLARNSSTDTWTGDIRSVEDLRSVKDILDGNYKQLGIWGKLKWGSMYFTSPEDAKRVFVVYAYEPTVFLNNGALAKLIDLTKDGKVSFAAAVSPEGEKWKQAFAQAGVRHDGDLWKGSIDGLTKAIASDQSQFKVISMSDKLLGVGSNGQFVRVDKDSSTPVWHTITLAGLSESK